MRNAPKPPADALVFFGATGDKARGAADARKVQELAPGSPQARQAQQILDRLGER